MKPKILIIDENPLTAENIRARLSAFGDTRVVNTVFGLDKARGETWSALVTEWSLGPMEGGALIKDLQSFGCPIFIYTHRSEAVESGAFYNANVAGAFTHLQRASLVIAVESAIQESGPPAPAKGPAPLFLLVEDSPTVRQFVKTVLLQAFPGSEAVEAEDGRQALNAMKTRQVSLIVTDLQMPGMDGMSFIQLLHNNAVLRKKPVVVLSAAVNDEVRASLKTLPKVQILTKPATPQKLADAVRLLLA
jgi:two-component system, chemotaxis family, chemotaxis protein CheY